MNSVCYMLILRNMGICSKKLVFETYLCRLSILSLLLLWLASPAMDVDEKVEKDFSICGRVNAAQSIINNVSPYVIVLLCL